MEHNIIFLTTAVSCVSLLAVLVKHLSSAAVGLSSFRATHFFKGSLADVDLAIGQLETRAQALAEIKDERSFRFLFGFACDAPERDAIYEAIRTGLLSERRVKLCKGLLRINESNRLEVTKYSVEKFELLTYCFGAIAMFANMVFTLTLMNKTDHAIRIIYIEAGFVITCMLGTFILIVSAIKVINIQETRKRLIDRGSSS